MELLFRATIMYRTLDLASAVTTHLDAVLTDGVQAGGLAVRSVNILFQVCLPPVAGSALKPASPTPPRGPAPLENPHEGGTPYSEFPDGEDPASRLRAPVSDGYGTISRRTVMKNVG